MISQGLVLLVALLALVGLTLLAIYGRRRLLVNAGGTVALDYQFRGSGAGRGWVLGLGRFAGDQLLWFRVFSLSVRPRRRFSRRDLRFVSQREPEPAERRALWGDVRIVECASSRGPVLLAMEPSALTGFLSWLEAAPPGATLPE